MDIILADNQDITRAGLLYICSGTEGTVKGTACDKAGLIELLREHPRAVVILDYTLFDINDTGELEILHIRFPDVRWILFSVDLTCDFVRRIAAVSRHFSVLLKESPMQEIRDCINLALAGHRYVCQRMTEMLLMQPQATAQRDDGLTPTEIEILKDIALGMTTKEIAAKRYSSFHTVNTHRKNIFRKLGVNNLHEATRYALRAGLVDSAEYYI